MSDKLQANRRKQRVRSSLKKKSNGRLRLSVFRSNQNIYAQIIDDKLGKTLVSASSLEIKSKELGAQDAICGGGSYDELVENLGGLSTPAVGFALGVERLIILLEQTKDSLVSQKNDIYRKCMINRALSVLN